MKKLPILKNTSDTESIGSSAEQQCSEAVTNVSSFFQGIDSWIAFCSAGAITIGMIGIYFYYLKKKNSSPPDYSAPDDLSELLSRSPNPSTDVPLYMPESYYDMDIYTHALKKLSEMQGRPIYESIHDPNFKNNVQFLLIQFSTIQKGIPLHISKGLQNLQLHSKAAMEAISYMTKKGIHDIEEEFPNLPNIPRGNQPHQSNPVELEQLTSEQVTLLQFAEFVRFKQLTGWSPTKFQKMHLECALIHLQMLVEQHEKGGTSRSASIEAITELPLVSEFLSRYAALQKSYNLPDISDEIKACIQDDDFYLNTFTSDERDRQKTLEAIENLPRAPDHKPNLLDTGNSGSSSIIPSPFEARLNHGFMVIFEAFECCQAEHLLIAILPFLIAWAVYDCFYRVYSLLYPKSI